MTTSRHLSDHDLPPGLAELLRASAAAAPMPAGLDEVPDRWVRAAQWRGAIRVLALAAAVGVGALLVALLLRLPQLAVTPIGGPLSGTEVSIRTGQPLRMTPEQAAAIAVEHYREMEGVREQALEPIRITSITAIEANRIDEVLPQEGAPLDTTRVVWVVQAQGIFVAPRTVPGEAGPRVGTSGHYVIWDRDGTLDGWGFNGVAPSDPAVEGTLKCLIGAGFPVSAATGSAELQSYLIRLPADSPLHECSELLLAD